jgi:hypothetical protein
MYVPTLSLEELQAQANVLNLPGMDSAEVAERFFMFGGIPRVVFSNDRDASEGMYTKAIAACRVEDLRYIHISDDRSEESVSHRLFQIQSTGPSYTIEKCDFVSEHVRNRLADKYKTARENLAKEEVSSPFPKLRAGTKSRVGLS